MLLKNKNLPVNPLLESHTWVDFLEVNEDIEKVDSEYIIDKANHKIMYSNISNVFSGTMSNMNICDHI